MAQPCGLLLPHQPQEQSAGSHEEHIPPSRWVQEHIPSCLQQTTGDTQTATRTLPLTFSHPLQCSAQGAHPPEGVSLHLVNLDHSTKAFNSTSKPDDGAVLAGSPASTHSTAQGAGPEGLPGAGLWPAAAADPTDTGTRVTPGCKARPLWVLLVPPGSDPAFPSPGEAAAWFLHRTEGTETGASHQQ